VRKSLLTLAMMVCCISCGNPSKIAYQDWVKIRNGDDGLKIEITWRLYCESSDKAGLFCYLNPAEKSYPVRVHNKEVQSNNGWGLYGSMSSRKYETSDTKDSFFPEVRKQDWIIVHGWSEGISKDGSVHIHAYDIVNEGFKNNLDGFKPGVKKGEMEVHNMNNAHLYVLYLNAALAVFNKKNGKYPECLNELVKAGFMKYLPLAPPDSSSRVVKEYDGRGGWVYDFKQKKVEFNYSGKDLTGLPYRDYGYWHN